MIRSLKCYHLSNPEVGEKLVRLRSVPRRVQSLVAEEAYGPRYRSLTCIRTVNLRPTLGFEMTLREETRTLPNALNTKRRCTVRGV